MGETLREEIGEVLERHGIPTELNGLVDELVEAADRHTEWWPDETIAEYVGTIMTKNVRQWAFKQGVKRRLMARAEDVRRAKAAMRGRRVGRELQAMRKARV